MQHRYGTQKKKNGEIKQHANVAAHRSTEFPKQQ
jgi:hypothetical protein